MGAGSLLLYTPIIASLISPKVLLFGRSLLFTKVTDIYLQSRDVASGLTISTWWLKLTAYTATDVYCFTKGMNASVFSF